MQAQGPKLVLLHDLNYAIKIIKAVICKATLYTKHISQGFYKVHQASLGIHMHFLGIHIHFVETIGTLQEAVGII